ncbi:MAG TPA: efflux RND transporter periplasmic adaptor subunit [Steroidobacteraceae bacterium]|jgi:RND family efflux transporter MFP subunit|nr:efflux RND transporter periplasmic adaptor subunit [Steroidobacteraceae bacterium]
MRLLKFGFLTLVLAGWIHGHCFAATTSTEDNGRIRAQLVSQHDVLISSQVEGKIAQLPFKDGDSFKRGDLLVEFDCELYEAQLQKTEASADAASKTYEINKQLSTLHSVGELDVEQAKAKAKETAAESAYVRAMVDHCRIVAPFTGRIAKRIAAQYEYVSAGKPLLQIVDDKNLELKLIVPSGWLAWLRVGTAVQVHMDDLNADYTASVTRLGARIDPVSQTFEVTAQIKGVRPELLPGMSGWVQFPQRK